MARRRRKDTIALASPPDMMRWNAESMADTTMRSHPAMKKVRDHITDEVLKAGKHAANKAMGTAMKRMGKKRAMPE